MAAIVRRLVGSAGSGKTTALMGLLDQLLDALGDLRKTGFVSFSRAARAEAVSRASAKFGVDEHTLRQEGWFRTIHAVCYSLADIRAGQLIVPDNKDGQAWLQQAIGVSLRTTLDDETGTRQYIGDGLHSRALNLWDRARNTLRPLQQLCDEEASIYSDSPAFVDVEPIVARYESAKRVDSRVDFCDLLLRFAGIRAGTGGYSECMPAGDVPPVQAWLVDEAQDLSPLTARIVARLADSPECQWLWLVGDPFQSIYGFAGATPRPFMDWPVEIQQVMPRSYRCPKVISDYGERILSGCSDYWQRNVEPAPHDGEIDFADMHDLPQLVDPSDDWLLIARTNFQAAQLRRLLDDSDIPNRSTRTDEISSERRGMRALWQLEQGQRVDPVEFAHALKLIPTKGLLEWGAKTQYDPSAHESIHLTNLTAAGCKEALQTAVFSGDWSSLVDGGQRFRDWADRHGVDTACMPRVRVGTIHSVKGAEADNVLLLNASCARFDIGAQASRERLDEELRLGYVGVTRARRRLIVASDAQCKYSMPGI